MARTKKSKGVAPHGKYAQIPVAVAKGVLAELSAPEFRVWFSLCMQCQHWANGTGKLCRTVIKEFHLGSQRVVTAATKKLLAGKYIIRTRPARQRICALYGVMYLPLNTDAMAKEGLSDAQIRAALTLFSASNRGSANSDTNGEALNVGIDNRGSAKALACPLALPQGKRIEPFSTSLALPQGNTSKRSATPLRIPESGSPSDSPAQLSSESASADERAKPGRELHVRIGNAARLLKAAPDTDNSKVARMYDLTEEQVLQARATA